MTEQIVFFGTVGILAIYGLCDLWVRLGARWWMPCRGDIRAVVILRGTRRDLPELLSPMARRFWKNRGISRVLFVDAGLDEESRRLADEWRGKSESFAVIDWSKLQESLQSETK